MNHILYMYETRVGIVGSTLVGVKIGQTSQEMWGRLRAYEVSGAQYTACVWKGIKDDVLYVERRFKEKFDQLNMRRKFETSAEEVFIGDPGGFADEIEDIISFSKYNVRFAYENYRSLNATQHYLFEKQNVSQQRIITSQSKIVIPAPKVSRVSMS